MLLLDHLRISSAVHDNMRSQPNFCSLAGQAEALLQRFQKEGESPPQTVIVVKLGTVKRAIIIYVMLYYINVFPNKILNFFFTHSLKCHGFSFFLLFYKMSQISVIPRQIWNMMRRILVKKIQHLRTFCIKVTSWICLPRPSQSSSLAWTLCVREGESLRVL